MIIVNILKRALITLVCFYVYIKMSLSPSSNGNFCRKIRSKTEILLFSSTFLSSRRVRLLELLSKYNTDLIDSKGSRFGKKTWFHIKFWKISIILFKKQTNLLCTSGARGKYLLIKSFKAEILIFFNSQFNWNNKNIIEKQTSKIQSYFFESKFRVFLVKRTFLVILRSSC